MLTREQIEVMEWPEIDRLVGIAAGFEECDGDVVIEGIPCGRWQGFIIDGEMRDDWHPTLNWNDAMLAAERFGLWSPPTGDRKFGGCYLQPPMRTGDGWCVADWAETGQESGNAVADADSGPLAICRAILRLAGERGR